MTPTYDQLLKDIKAAGVNFSDYDLAFAKENPTAGYGILNAKRDYAAATTPEARALANAAAEQWRSQGGYSAGIYGNGYNPILPQSTGNSMLDSKTAQLSSYPSYQNSLQAPSFGDQYGSMYNEALNKQVNYAPFSYDYKTDPLYSSYKQAYTREGQRATADALGSAAAATGGIPSSFAATAAAQAGNYYAAQLADKIPELYQLAYSQYADQYNRLSNNVGTLMNARNFDFNTYQTALDQYNQDRAFDYGVYSDDFNRLASQIGVLTDQDNTAYQRQQDALAAALRGRSSTQVPTPVATKDYMTNTEYQLYYNKALSDPLYASQILSDQFDRLNATQKLQLGQAAGLSTKEIYRLTGNDAGNLYNALLSNVPEDTSREAVYNNQYVPGETTDKSSLNYSPDEGIFVWNKKVYNNPSALMQDINNSGLSDADMTALKKKLKMYGFTVS